MKMDKVRAVATFCLVAAFCAMQAGSVGASTDEKELNGMFEKARALAADPAYEPYAGWLEYLVEKIEAYRRRGLPQAKIDPVVATLGEWLGRIEADPDAWKRMRGVQEWAYISKVDATAQPFTINIPDDYDDSRPWPFRVRLHGGWHTHEGPKGAPHPYPYLELRPLGRGRVGGFIGLSEIDVLESIEFVKRHWNVDPTRVHVHGGSMGGSGSYRMATRHPDMFATASPRAGWALEIPLENMLHVPMFALHSSDDPKVPVACDRAAVRKIEQSGGQAIMDEFDGYGHGASRNVEAVKRANEWILRHVLPASVRRVHFEATDELARRAYWVEVVEWGPEGRPATIDARIDTANVLYLTLDNVSVARIDLAGSPANSNGELMVVVNRTIVDTLGPPLPRAVYVVLEGDGWRITEQGPAPPDIRLHFPGGKTALYHGEPIMIVWGTQGDEETDRRLYDIAQLSRRISSPGWPSTQPPIDGIPKHYMMYGQLPGKPDVDVTARDMAKYNLMLLGDARQNAVVAQLADKLPVRVEDGKVLSNDGFAWDFKDRALGLLYYNPLEPQRLVYWIAADTIEYYRPLAPLMDERSAAPADFMISAADKSQIVAARRFDSRWNWEPGYGESRAIRTAVTTEADSVIAFAHAIRRAAVADFALVAAADWNSTRPVASETRRMDMTAVHYDERITAMDITGREILDAAELIENNRSARGHIGRFIPMPQPETIDEERTYRVAMGPMTMWEYGKLTKTNPASFRITDVTVKDAIARFWPDRKPSSN